MTAAWDWSQTITHLLLNLEDWTSISLAFASVTRAGKVALIWRKNNSYFIGEREIIISSSLTPDNIINVKMLMKCYSFRVFSFQVIVGNKKMGRVLNPTPRGYLCPSGTLFSFVFLTLLSANDRKLGCD